MRALAFVIVVAGVSCSTAAPPPAGDGAATVVEPIDGDTVDVRVGGHTERVRLLGIDTPETKHPTKPVECFGPEASAALAELLPPGTEITLERDAQSRDDYGRLLAYVHRGALFVNVALVEDGFAETLSIEPNTAYARQLSAAEASARGAHRGRWGACAASKDDQPR